MSFLNFHSSFNPWFPFLQHFWNLLMKTIAAVAAKSLQSCPTLCDPIDGSPPGSAVPGILQPRTLEWVAISFSSAWKWRVKVKLLSRVRLLATPWTAAHQAPPFMGFPRQEYWSGVPLPSPNYLSECVANSCWFTNLKAGILKQILCLHLFLGICVSYLPLKRE